ncbi:hypothetical protein LTR53_006007 [Teratosphaeriaceae sp. CCFEE 6253]|nr:hypothetical protein LTR53_006007 [Teratosphaeriaceae sp. CCFEE 6253]
MLNLMNSASSAMTAAAQSTPQNYLKEISAGYDSAMSAASSQLALASSSASALYHGPTKGTLEQATDSAGSVYNDSASQISSAIYGTDTPWTEAMVSSASANREAIIARASSHVYGQPPPFTDSVMGQASFYAAQSDASRIHQYEVVQQLFAELISGKEPDFTKSVMRRLQSVYASGVPGAISSDQLPWQYCRHCLKPYEGYCVQYLELCRSVISSVFTPPAALNTVMDDINEQLNAAVDAASVQSYGSTKGTYESATEQVASAFSNVASSVGDAQDAAARAYSHTASILSATIYGTTTGSLESLGSKASEALYGHETGYAEAAQASLTSIADLASKSISEPIYGTPTPNIAAASRSASSVYDSLTSAVSQQAAAVSSAVSSAI